MTTAFAVTIIPVVEVPIQVLTLLDFGSFLPEGSCSTHSNWSDKALLILCHRPLRFCLPGDFPKNSSINLYKEIALRGLGASPLMTGWGAQMHFTPGPCQRQTELPLNRCPSLNSFTEQVEQKGNILISKLLSFET